MFLKIHKAYRDVIAICDSDLIGQIFEEGQKQLEVKESFFKGDEKTEQEILEIMQSFSKEDATFNIVGRQATQLALKAGIIDEQAIGNIKNIPFALVLI